MTERLAPVVRADRPAGGVRGGQHRGGVGEGTRRDHPLDPGRRRAEIAERGADLRRVHRVQQTHHRTAARGGVRRAENAEAADAAVRIDVQPDMRGVGRRRELGLKHVQMVGLQLQLRQCGRPVGNRARRHIGGDAAPGFLHHRGLDRRGVGVVALEVRRVELQARDRPRHAEMDHRPVVAGAAPPLRLPPVAHVRRRIGHQHVARLAEESIARVDDVTAEHGGGEIHVRPGGEDARPVGQRLAHDAKPRHAAVRKDVEADVCHAAFAPRRDLDGEGIPAVARELAALEHGIPGDLVAAGIRPGRQAAAVDPAVRRKVAAEERRVDDDRVNHAGLAEPDDAPVVAGRAPAARLPAVHPLPAIGVLVRNEYRRRRLEQVLLPGEELVVGGDGLAAEAGGGEIEEVGQFTHCGCPSRYTSRPRAYVSLIRPRSVMPS